MPSVAEILNEHVFKLINNKEIKAKHIVTKVFYGASIEKTMKYTHKINQDSRKISVTAYFNQILKYSLYFKIKTGSLCGNLKKGLVDLSDNFMLDLDKENNSESCSITNQSIVTTSERSQHNYNN
jgi:hypothetical protein